MTYCFFGGKIIERQEAKIDIGDLGFLRGFGVFDLALSYKNKIFLENEHLERLQTSARLLNLHLPYPIEKISALTKELLEKNDLDRSIVRWVLSGGESQNGVVSSKPTFAILIENYHPYPDKFYKHGIKVETVNVRREIPQAKTLNYQVAFTRYQKGATEIIYTPNGEVLEGGKSNVFLVKDDQIVTAKNDVLAGITRANLIRIAKTNKIDITLRKIEKSELQTADEVFITASNIRVMPVVEIDGSKISNGKPGPITQKLMSLFANFEKERVGA